MGDVFGGLAFARSTLDSEVPAILEVRKKGGVQLVIGRAYVWEGGEGEAGGRRPVWDMVVYGKQKVLLLVRSFPLQLWKIHGY